MGETKRPVTSGAKGPRAAWLKRLARAVARLSVRLTQFMSELGYWQRRSAILSLAPDRYLAHPDRAPDTFSEFMARTSGPLLREPSCKARLAGRSVG
ncbi:MAG: hypothetical protein ACTHJW_20730 [Streptosporangiaceae bacterium]